MMTLVLEKVQSSLTVAHPFECSLWIELWILFRYYVDVITTWGLVRLGFLFLGTCGKDIRFCLWFCRAVG